MNEGYSDEVEDWLRNFTTGGWSSMPATHCMSSRYQRLDSRSWPFPGVPVFRKDSVEGDQTIDEAANFEEAGGSGSSVREDHDRMIEFIVETREQFRDYVSEDSEDARNLREDIIRLEEDTKRLASLIDEKFKVVRERPQEELEELREAVREHPHLAPHLDTSKQVETNTVRETRRLQNLLDRAKREGSGDNFRDVFDSAVETKDKSWSPTYEQPSSAHLISQRPKPNGDDPPYQLLETRVRPCVSLSLAGYETGLDYFPADATIEQAEAYFKLYGKDLRQRADSYGNTHALLFFRLRMAEMVYHEYEQYRSVEEWTPGIVKKKWVDRDFSASNVQNPAQLMSEMEELLVSPPYDGKDVWRKEEGTWVPNVAGLYSHLSERDQDLLRREPDARSSNPFISRQTLRRYVKYFTETKLVKLRSEAGREPT